MFPEARPQSVYLKDYQSPAYLIDRIDLRFELGEERTCVQSRLELRPNPARSGDPGPLILDGQDLALHSVILDGRALAADEYRVADESLSLQVPAVASVLEIETEIRPRDNTALEGLYTSSGNFCTQCEAEGFRRITYYPDRPDVMARFTTTIVAGRERYPVLLSNGNLVESGELEDGRHWARWEDPFPKPCYLFALVAGDLLRIADSFTTASGREVALHIYVQEKNADQCAHAMRSLQNAMRWDEQAYGREYDLDLYTIVAVDDFNMGAMENKGLNIFNSKYVLARPETGTDGDFENIEGVIGHEYFHNWSGNRVTLRDWFQLSLKEGFTVFRDQQFSADMTSPAVKRIQDVNGLRSYQFAEDDGPTAHPVRPDSYVEINNFYTMTVYEKGAEVARMLHTLLGAEGFRRGTDLYFERHDGQAVTTDDFLRAMQDANEVDLSQFQRWYDQAGTPLLRVGTRYDPTEQSLTIELAQSCPATPGQAEKAPFLIPVAVGLLDSGGRDMPLRLAGQGVSNGARTRVLELREATETFRFLDVPEPPRLSILRGFSAPVKLDMQQSEAELAFLMAHDSDAFNRWDAGQRLAVRVLGRLLEARAEPSLDPSLSEAFAQVLGDPALDRRLVAQAISLPSETYLAELFEPVDPQAIHAARVFLRQTLAAALKQQLLSTYDACRAHGEYSLDGESVGRRRLRNVCLAYLMELDEAQGLALCMEQFRTADNMTDSLAALGSLGNRDCPERRQALDVFYRRWQDDVLVVDKWFSIQATSRLPDTLDAVKALMEHADFNLRNPNRVRALVGAFCQGNPVRFHDPSGAGYRFLADQVLELNGLNPQLAARLLTPLKNWRRYETRYATAMRAELARIGEAPGLSRDVYEIVSKSLEPRLTGK